MRMTVALIAVLTLSAAFPPVGEDFTEGPMIEDNPKEFYYILKHYVIQDRAVMGDHSLPLGFTWKCTDRATHCIELGNKCQLPAEFYATEYEREQCR